jgi:hypothetical protein
MKKSFLKFLSDAKPIILSLMEKEIVKIAMSTVLKSAITGGIRGWIIKFSVEYLFEEVARPIVDLSFRKLGYFIEVKNGEYLLKKIKNSSNVGEWNSITNSV